MKAIWNNQVIAESNETIVIEGNHYFPKHAVKSEFLTSSELHTTCPWKGEASYYSIKVGDATNQDAAWYYPAPKPRALEIVGKDFSSYIAFWRGVQVSE
jgi:uncharacterized protein (DUF427 family)